MSRYFRAGKVPAMQKGRYVLRQRQGAGKSLFRGGAWGSDPERGWRRFGRLGKQVFWELP